ncbi:hypothetical protein [Candidatus Sordicultor fermentans]|jgi:hypothetical protein|uniref:hypothetical protein n=1 Tax=Candidatus Sordicultor fermentans TaxID=1953203 RepID=UPI0016B72C7F|nr:hypothetical protein [Atribacterota bacterium]NLY04586.1 hypothetical protein [Candidatus Atribacteria bacterium]
MSDFAERIGKTLAEIERTKRMAGAPDRVASYLSPLYTSLIRDIMSEVKQQVKEEVLKELKNHDVD